MNDLQGAPAAYVCRGFVCDRPVVTPDALLDAIRHDPDVGALPRPSR